MSKITSNLDRLSAHLKKMTDRQAVCIGTPIDGPLKPDHYREKP